MFKMAPEFDAKVYLLFYKKHPTVKQAPSGWGEIRTTTRIGGQLSQIAEDGRDGRFLFIDVGQIAAAGEIDRIQLRRIWRGLIYL